MKGLFALRFPLSALASLFVLGCACHAADPAPMINPTGTTAPPPAVKPLDANAGIDEVLDGLQAVGATLKDFTANVKHTTDDSMADKASTNVGKIWYQAKGDGDARIHIDFVETIVGERKFTDQRKEYLLDGSYLIDRDYKGHKQVKRMVVKPGQKLNLLKLGEGPFPLPIGQAKDDVKRLFTVTKVASGKDDPKDTIHLQLVPTPANAQLIKKFKSVDVWVDTKTSFPVKIQTQDVPGRITTTTELNLTGAGLGVNQGIGDKEFKLEDVGKGWDLIED